MHLSNSQQTSLRMGYIYEKDIYTNQIFRIYGQAWPKKSLSSKVPKKSLSSKVPKKSLSSKVSIRRAAANASCLRKHGCVYIGVQELNLMQRNLLQKE
ncbi:hypothetical protein PVAP13_9NG210200 [Panicum virgatum]|uniref:Uncharacterized protein n=1 Tax=Panicum virgatum TaxID=38727 RepID=A0A8T0MI31_PANVG|nr:hypothetical protein PVAP13_9NG210200 [Panicum virgatum]